MPRKSFLAIIMATLLGVMTFSLGAVDAHAAEAKRGGTLRIGYW